MGMPEDRKQIILELLEERNAVTVVELSGVLSLSEVSVRKILKDMEDSGLLKRTWGGAVSRSGSQKELEHDQKATRHISEKNAMAAVALSLINDGDAIFLDSGSTNLALAELLAKQSWQNLAVGTNALNIASRLANIKGITVIMTGGELRGNALSCVGPIAENTLKTTFFDKGFVSTYRITPRHGISTPNVYEAHFKQCLMRACKENIVMADHSKFGDDSMMQIAELDELDCIITDWLISAEMLRQIQDINENVIVAEKKDEA